MAAAGIEKTVAGVLNTLAILSGLGVVALTGFLVLARFINYSVVGLHEIISTAALLFYMVGAILASRNKAHLMVDWLDQQLTSPRARAIHALIVALLTTTITLIFVYWAYRMLAWGMERPQWTPAYHIPLWLPQMSILLGAVGCVAYGLRDLALSLAALKSTKS